MNVSQGFVYSDHRSPLATALEDIRGGLAWRGLWLRLGLLDIRHRYRRSVLGPLWLTLSMGVLVGSLGVIYAQLFRADPAEYIPYVALGFIIWQFVSGVLTESSRQFVSAENVIKQIRLPYSVHSFQGTLSHLIILAHNMLVFVFVSFVFQIVPNANIWYAIPALLLYAVNAVWLSLFLNVLCLRYRDIPPMIASIVQIAFFVTPIIWKPELLGNRTAVMDFNVFYYFVEILRLPLLGQAPPDHAWLVIGGLAVFGWALALVTLGLNYRRIPYWL